MDESSIIKYLRDTFDGVEIVTASRDSGAPEIAWGDTFIFYDPDGTTDPNRRWPFATIVTKDYGEFDRASDLNRSGVFRLNIGVSKETYRRLFGPQPSPAGPSGFVETGHDFAALDQIMPHPVYAPQSWICVLNPSETTFQQSVQPLLADAFNDAVRKQAKALPADNS